MRLVTAEAVGCDDESDRFGVLDVVARLVDKSLVQVDHEYGDARYRMIQSVRQFLQARLEQSGEADALRERHFRYFGR